MKLYFQIFLSVICSKTSHNFVGKINCFGVECKILIIVLAQLLITSYYSIVGVVDVTVGVGSVYNNMRIIMECWTCCCCIITNMSPIIQSWVYCYINDLGSQHIVHRNYESGDAFKVLKHISDGTNCLLLTEITSKLKDVASLAFLPKYILSSNFSRINSFMRSNRKL